MKISDIRLTFDDLDAILEDLDREEQERAKRYCTLNPDNIERQRMATIYACALSNVRCAVLEKTGIVRR